MAGGRGPGLSEPPDWKPGGNSLPRPSYCLGNSYRQRQTALFTDICQPSSQPGAWVSTGRRRPVSEDGATAEGQALFTHSRAAPAPTGSCVCVHRWPGGPCSAHTAPGRPAGLPASLLPSFPLILPSFFSPNRCLEDVPFVLQTCAGQQDFKLLRLRFSPQPEEALGREAL